MPPDISGSFNARPVLRAWWPTLFLFAFVCASAALFAFPQNTHALTRHSVNTYKTNSGSFGSGPFTTGTFTPPIGSLLVVAVSVMESSGTSDPSDDITITDSAGHTWTPRATIGNTTSWSIGMRIFTAPIGTSTPLTLTVDAGSLSIHSYIVHAVAYTGYNKTNPVGTTATSGSGATDGSYTISLASTAAPTSEVFAGLYIDESSCPVTVAPGTGWTELAESTVGCSEGVLQTQSRVASTSVSVTWNDVAEGGVIFKDIAAAIEIKSKAALAKPPNNLGLVGYWSFNEGTSTKATDFSGNGNAGTLTAGPTWTSGKRGKALNFDGSGARVEVTENSGLPLYSTNTAYSVSAWVKGAAQINAVIFAERNSGGNAELGIVADSAVANGKLEIIIVNDAGSVVLDAKPDVIALDDTWHHIAWTDNNGTAKLYVDGVPAPNSDYTRSGAYTLDRTNIGAVDNGGFAFNGKIDEVRVYNRALGATEVAKLYGSGAVKIGASSADLQRGSTLANGLVGLWTFDGADLTDRVYDRSGADNHGYFVGGATSSAKTIGKLGQALDFRGAADYVRLGDIAATDAQTNLTWSFWVYQTSFIEQRWYMGKGNPNSETQMSWAIMTEPSGFNPGIDAIGVTIANALNSSDPEAHCSAATAVALLNQWMHVAVVYNGTLTDNENRINIYTNGVNRPVNECIGDDVYPAATLDSSASVTIGDSSEIGQRNSNVKMDDVRIYNRALSPAEVAQLYKLGTVIIRP